MIIANRSVIVFHLIDYFDVSIIKLLNKANSDTTGIKNFPYPAIKTRHEESIEPHL